MHLLCIKMNKVLPFSSSNGQHMKPQRKMKPAHPENTGCQEGCTSLPRSGHCLSEAARVILVPLWSPVHTSLLQNRPQKTKLSNLRLSKSFFVSSRHTSTGASEVVRCTALGLHTSGLRYGYTSKQHRNPLHGSHIMHVYKHCYHNHL